jgi:glutamyl-tRNA reductase
MAFFVIGTNHKCSPWNLRERLAFSQRARRDALSLLKERKILNGAVIVSTCNRVEVYGSSDDGQRGINEALNFLSEYKDINKEFLSPYLYIRSGQEAVKHLFTISAGLDSMVVGEQQILGQLKFSCHESEDMGFLGHMLGETFQAAL